MADTNILSDFGINILEEEIDDVIFQTNEFLCDATFTGSQGPFWWLAKFCPLSSLLIVLNQQLVKSCTMRQNFDGTKMGQNRRKIKPRPLCSEYPYQNTLVPSTKVQICPVKNEQMNLFLSFITHFSIILYHDRFFKVSDTLLHVLPLNNVSLIIVHCSRQMPIIRIGICTLLLSDLIQILRL